MFAFLSLLSLKYALLRTERFIFGPVMQRGLSFFLFLFHTRRDSSVLESETSIHVHPVPLLVLPTLITSLLGLHSLRLQAPIICNKLILCLTDNLQVTIISTFYTMKKANDINMKSSFSTVSTQN